MEQGAKIKIPVGPMTKKADKRENYKIDILAMELEQKLPHWLDWRQRNPEKVREIRERNRAKWLAQRKAKKERPKNSSRAFECSTIEYRQRTRHLPAIRKIL